MRYSKSVPRMTSTPERPGARQRRWHRSRFADSSSLSWDASIHDLTAYNKSFGALEPEKLQDWQQSAADYAMHTPDSAQKVLNPFGQWNTSRIVFTTEIVEHWLNGKKVLSFVPWSEDWYEKRNSGKWENSPDYGKFKTGYIGFQDHGSDLWFRNIKIKKLWSEYYYIQDSSPCLDCL